MVKEHACFPGKPRTIKPECANGKRLRALFYRKEGTAMEDMQKKAHFQKKTPLFDQVCAKLQKNSDFRVRPILIGQRFQGAFVFLDGMINSGQLSELVMRSLVEHRFEADATVEDLYAYIDSGGIYCPDQKKQTEADVIIKQMLTGSAALFFDGAAEAYTFEIKSTFVRSVSEPTNENITKGGKDAFVERWLINTALVRSRLHSPDIVVETVTVGRQSNTNIAVVYLQNTANPDLVQKAKDCLLGMDVDSIASLGIVEEALCGDDNSIFPQVTNTERPDSFCADINEGYIGIIIDGFPFALLVPGSILQQMQAPEDYARHPVFASAIRVLRFLLMGVTLLLPGFYVSILSFHQEMLPSRLVQSIMKARLEVPFDELIEMVVMLVAFEVLIEAGLRMPKNIGQAVSIVGALIVGEAAVSAKLISPAVVIVVAITAIASFTLPSQDLSNAVRVWRFVLLLFSGMLGLVGLVLGAILLTLRICSLEVLGVPYMAPIIGGHTETKDSYFRRPFLQDQKRPEFLGNQNKTRRRTKG